MFPHPWQALQQRLSNFLQTGLPLDKWNQGFWKLTKPRKHSLEQNTWWIPLKQRVLTSLAYIATNYEKLLQIELCPDKWDQESQKPSPKFRSHCSEQIAWWTPMKQSVLTLLVCIATKSGYLHKQNCVLPFEIKYSRKPTQNPENFKNCSEQNTQWIPTKHNVSTSLNITAIKSEQHLQIELYLEKLNQVFTKPLTKIQQTLIGAKNLVNSNETKKFCLLNMYCNKVWAQKICTWSFSKFSGSWSL